MLDPEVKRLKPYPKAAVGKFVSEGYIGGVLDVEIDEIGLLVVALKAVELFLQFKPGHATWINRR